VIVGKVSIGDWFMKSRFVLFLALGLVVLTAAPVGAQPRGFRRGGQPAGGYGWIFNLEEGKTQARQSGKPLMVVVRCVP
jgi:hypothetical protein